MSGTRWALLSVTDKTGLDQFARGLHEQGFSLLSSGGTARYLRDAGLSVTDVSEHTGSPEILGGRVKTLHPKVHGGILARANHPGDDQELAEHSIDAIELVAVNLYRFEEAVREFEANNSGDVDAGSAAVAEVLEQIDIGGPTLLRAAAKNVPRVAVVVDPADYSQILGALQEHGNVPLGMRGTLAGKAFSLVARYDQAIEEFFARHLMDGAATGSGHGALVDGDLPAALAHCFTEGEPGSDDAALVLRYGENPHQRGVAVRGREPGEASVMHARRLGGKALSYNNFLDAEAALETVKEFEESAAVVIKHANPCGVAVGNSQVEVFENAKAGDPVSAFGGILAFNRPLGMEAARAIATKQNFFEVLVAPDFEEGVLDVLKTGAAWGKNLRILACGDPKRQEATRPQWTFRPMVGGALIQERDLKDTFHPEVVTERAPDDAELRDLAMAWKIVKHVHSNAIVFVKDGALQGVGAGQMSRVDSVGLAAKKAGEGAKGAVMGSDAFFPFRDGVDAAIQAGVTAVVQPGGSRRDGEVIAACNESQVAMVVTGHRHFLH